MYYKRVVFTILLIGAALSFSFLELNAEPVKDKADFEQNDEENEPLDDIKLPNDVDTYVRYMPSSGVKAIDGKVELIESNFNYKYGFKVMDELPVNFLFTHEYIKINKTIDFPLPSHLTGFGIGLETTLPFFFDHTYLRIGAIPSFYSDDWNINSSLFRMSGRLFLIYKPNKKWTYVFGAGILPNHNTEALPILGFIYKPDEKWTFNLVPDNPNITYALNDKMAVFIEGFGTNDEYEVTKNGTKGVTLKYREIHCGTGMTYNINKAISCSLAVGGMFNRSLKYRHDEGKVSIKDGMYTEFKVAISL